MAAVIGDPVAHSLSPAIHNAAFLEMGLDWVYTAFRVRRGDAASAVAAMRALRLAGLSVTMPHKEGVAAAVDRLGPVAERLGVVNTVAWEGPGDDDALVGESTDGPGFLDALSEEGFTPDGRSCLVLGAGGAARAVAVALVDAGASPVGVAARRLEAADGVVTLSGSSGQPVDAADGEALRQQVEAADLIVNATPVGMGDDGGIPFGLAPDWLRPGQFVADLIYRPALTPLLAAARQAGADGCNGLGMLINQAGRQIELWTGRVPPLDAMSAAALSAIASDGRRDSSIGTR